MDANISYIPLIIDRTGCGRHGVFTGAPCWTIDTASGAELSGVCGFRAKKAGFRGTPSDASIRRRR